MIEEITVRCSSLSDYQDCPRRFAGRHLKDMIAAAGYEVRTMGPAHVGAAIGTGVHAAAERTVSHMLAGEGLGTDAEAEEAAVEAFRDRAAIEGCAWDDITSSVDTAHKQLRRMSRTWRRHIAPAIQPIAVESRLEAVMPGGLVLSGQPDIIDGRTIRDLKTASRGTWPLVQMGGYAMLGQAHGFTIERLVQDRVPRTPLAKEQPPPETLPLDVATARMDAHEALQGIMRDTAEFQRRAADPRGLPPPGAFRPNPGSQLCSARWCPAFATPWCKSHRA